MKLIHFPFVCILPVPFSLLRMVHFINEVERPELNNFTKVSSCAGVHTAEDKHL